MLAVYSRLVFTTVSTAVIPVLHYFLGVAVPFHRDHFDAYRNRSLAILAVDKFRKVNFLNQALAFDRYLSNELAHVLSTFNSSLTATCAAL